METKVHKRHCLHEAGVRKYAAFQVREFTAGTVKFVLKSCGFKSEFAVVSIVGLIMCRLLSFTQCFTSSVMVGV